MRNRVLRVPKNQFRTERPCHDEDCGGCARSGHHHYYVDHGCRNRWGAVPGESNILSRPRNREIRSPQGDTEGHQIPLYPIRSGPRYHFVQYLGCRNAAAGIFRIWLRVAERLETPIALGHHIDPVSSLERLETPIGVGSHQPLAWVPSCLVSTEPG